MRLALAGLMVAVLRTGCAFCLHTGHLNCNSDGKGSVTHCVGLTRRGVYGRAKALSRSKTRRRMLRASWAEERLSGHARRIDNALEHVPEHEHEHRDATVVAGPLVRRRSRRVFETGNMGMATVVEGDRPPVMPSVGISMAGALPYPSSAAVYSISMHTAQGPAKPKMQLLYTNDKVANASETSDLEVCPEDSNILVDAASLVSPLWCQVRRCRPRRRSCTTQFLSPAGGGMLYSTSPVMFHIYWNVSMSTFLSLKRFRLFS
ncbi:hypothetical protein Esi_0095_0091 [Ectocarpus siliculosus]|uniref:Uncharacterized protein n=1 Tax=Ectocarpus siliculosus TaxID=2880 RepID=D8LU77_ECTSI|nr:hypothetical protein Esi_0095_0091 [Ectocarpus siliculosus]|eukprot:CBN78119.1 hypothetical protein Esi_0095_0091 [Ectocarpus siliculosus]